MKFSRLSFFMLTMAGLTFLNTAHAQTWFQGPEEPIDSADVWSSSKTPNYSRGEIFTIFFDSDNLAEDSQYHIIAEINAEGKLPDWRRFGGWIADGVFFRDSSSSSICRPHKDIIGTGNFIVGPIGGTWKMSLIPSGFRCEAEICLQDPNQFIGSLCTRRADLDHTVTWSELTYVNSYRVHAYCMNKTFEEKADAGEKYILMKSSVISTEDTPMPPPDILKFKGTIQVGPFKKSECPHGVEFDVANFNHGPRDTFTRNPIEWVPLLFPPFSSTTKKTEPARSTYDLEFKSGNFKVLTREVQ